jgi:hypothetical protein
MASSGPETMYLCRLCRFLNVDVDFRRKREMDARQGGFGDEMVTRM